MIVMTNPRFPILIYLNLDEVKKISQDLNEGRINLVRVSKLNHETEMKKAVWKSM